MLQRTINNAGFGRKRSQRTINQLEMDIAKQKQVILGRNPYVQFTRSQNNDLMTHNPYFCDLRRKKR